MCVQVDEALLEQQQQAYAVEGVDETEAAQPQKKRKKENAYDDPVRHHTVPDALGMPKY